MGEVVRIGSRLCNCYRAIHMRRCWCQYGWARSDGRAVRWTSLYGQRLACRDERITERRNMPRRNIWSEDQHYRTAGFNLLAAIVIYLEYRSPRRSSQAADVC